MRRLASHLFIIGVLAFAIAVSTPVQAIALSLRQAHDREAPEEARPILKSYRELLGLPSTPTGPGVRPDQTYSKWSWPGSGYYTNTAQRLTIEPGTTEGSYFWAYEFFFADLGAGSNGGYVGLQDGGGDTGTKIALFAIWGANDAEGKDCRHIDEDGPVWSCRIEPYDWQTNREYRLMIQQDGSETGGTWWKATVLDTETLVQQTIGRIRVPPTWGNVHGVDSFTEYFGPLEPTCADLPRSRVRFKYPVANAGSVAISGHTTDIQPWNCRSTIYELNGADRHVVPTAPK